MEEAISEIGREEVFEAKMVLAGACATEILKPSGFEEEGFIETIITLSSYSANSFCFNSMFSTTASTTRSAVWMAASTVVSMCMLERELGRLVLFGQERRNWKAKKPRCIRFFD